MTLGQLRKSLAKHPPDMDDLEISVMVSRKGQKQMEPLCFVGYLPLPGNEKILLGTLTAVQTMVENGEIEPPEGYLDPSDTDKRIFGDSDDSH